MSLHKSGKMLLALYDNAVLRLWNMQSARCTFKKKIGLIEDMDEKDQSDQKSENDEEEEDILKEITKKDLDESSRKPI